jgi:hypothetical protein
MLECRGRSSDLLAGNAGLARLASLMTGCYAGCYAGCHAGCHAGVQGMSVLFFLKGE